MEKNGSIGSRPILRLNHAGLPVTALRYRGGNRAVTTGSARGGEDSNGKENFKTKIRQRRKPLSFVLVLSAVYDSQQQQ
jgi:hypothetical protein